MECVLKVISGADAGEELRCSGPETVLGKGARSAVRFSGAGVSYEHALIVRGEGAFFVENLSANGTFVNEERISGRVKLRARDRVRLSADTVVRVESMTVEGAAARGNGRTRLLLVVVVLRRAARRAAVLVDPFGGTGAADYGLAYGKLLAWVDGVEGTGQVPAGTAGLLRSAWRLEQAGDKAGAGKEWVRLQVLLAGGAGTLPPVGPNDQRALDRLMQGKATLNDEGMGAGLVEFVTMEARGAR